MGRNGTTKQVPWNLFPLWGLLALGVLVVIWGLYGKARLCGQTAKARQAKRAVTHGCALALGQDLTRHHCFRYCNRRSLPPGYFHRAVASLSDGAVYLVLTQSNSPAGEVIGLITDRTYNHVSLALDRDLHTLVSYNGGDGIAPPGLNPETLGGLLRRPGAAGRLMEHLLQGGHRLGGGVGLGGVLVDRNGLLQLAAQDEDLPGGVDAQHHAAAVSGGHREDGQADVVPDGQGLPRPAGQDQHSSTASLGADRSASLWRMW